MCELREMRVVENVAATRIFDKTRRVRALALVTTLLAISANAAERRGAFAFHYGPPLTPRQLRWFARFDVVVTHDPLPRAQVDALHARGTKLLVYEWSVAFYGSLANAWQRALLQQHPDALLNRAGLRGGAGSADAEAWYYDPASDSHRARRARAMARRRLRPRVPALPRKSAARAAWETDLHEPGLPESGRLPAVRRLGYDGEPDHVEGRRAAAVGRSARSVEFDPLSVRARDRAGARALPARPLRASELRRRGRGAARRGDGEAFRRRRLRRRSRVSALLRRPRRATHRARRRE